MPVYCYRHPTGSLIQVFMPINEMLEKHRESFVDKDGTVCPRDFAAEHPAQRSAGTWPMKSDAMGCHPSQIQEFHEHSVQLGVPTQFTPEGQAIFTGPNHRKKYCRAYGFRDRNGGYGDP
jgi:hypothetical protein